MPNNHESRRPSAEEQVVTENHDSGVHRKPQSSEQAYKQHLKAYRKAALDLYVLQEKMRRGSKLYIAQARQELFAGVTNSKKEEDEVQDYALQATAHDARELRKLKTDLEKLGAGLDPEVKAKLEQRPTLTFGSAEEQPGPELELESSEAPTAPGRSSKDPGDPWERAWSTEAAEKEPDGPWEKVVGWANKLTGKE